MPRVVSFEISTQDPQRTVAFYANVFGWEFAEPRWDYWPARTGPAGQPGIDGGISRGPADYPHGTRLTIEVPSIDEYIDKAVSNGARIVRPKMAFDGFYLAYLVDPTGIGFGLIQYDPAARLTD
jgi:predicted enzyme related to lactoylglutathione lyase